MFSLLPVAKTETIYLPYYDPFQRYVGWHGAMWDIMFLYRKGIIGGCPDGTFRPNGPITRAQASAMLLRALDIPLQENPSVTFKDVSNESTHYRTLGTINDKGILRGSRPGRYFFGA